MWLAPRRPNNDITQSFNDGIVTISKTTNTAAAGYAPHIALVPKIELRYSEQRLGIQRYYSAMQNQIEVQRVIRVPRTDNVNSQDIATTEDGRMYRIDLVQTVDVYPPSVDLTLVAYKQEATL